jgi:colicin import membrane protein
MTFRLPHLIAALALHVLVLGLLLGGVQCSAKPHQPPVITAVLLDPSRTQQLERQRAEQKRLDQRRQAEQERKRREDEARRQRLADEQKQAEAQKRAQAEAEARKKKDADAQRQKQLADKKAAELKAAEQKKAAEAARLKQEQTEKAEKAAAAKREAEERARVELAMREEALRREADLEQRARAEGERQTRLAEWAEALVAHVQRNYKTPPGAPAEFACQVRMQLLPDGTVTNAKIVKSCGSAPLDRAVEDAVYRSSPLPKPADPSVFDRDLTINFTP